MNKIKLDDNKSLLNFIKKYNGPYIYSDKLDGYSAMLIKINDKLHMYGRGDGNYGFEKTKFIKYINFGIDVIKLKDMMENNMAIRGELIMSKNNFTIYNN